VRGDEDEWRAWRRVGDPVLHIELRRWADVGVVAPASANSLAKFANVRVWRFGWSFFGGEERGGEEKREKPPPPPFRKKTSTNNEQKNEQKKEQRKQPHQPKQGLCDNLLTSVVRAWDWDAKPLLLAPAMNTAMWASPLTGRHLSLLKSLGAGVVPPVAKALACGDVGMGAMAEPEEVAVAVKGALGLA